MRIDDLKKRLKDILLKKSVITGKEFTLSSGKKSNFYVDARITTLDSEGAYLCGKIFFELLKEFQVDAVGGYSIGADPIVSSIAVISFIENKPIPAFIIRKEKKEYGTGKAIEGNFKPGMKVALFDDVITSGGSIIKGINTVKENRGDIQVIMSVIDREEGGEERIKEYGYKLISIFKKSDLI